MTDYVIGDIQGCYEPFMRLLDHLHFDGTADRLWFVGDLVNRGPHSLDVLRFIKQLPLKPRITLGNHDLHLLNQLFGKHHKWNPDDDLHEVLLAPDAEELGHWLRKQHILYHDSTLNIVMTHAGIAPVWDLSEAKRYAKELESVLSGDHIHDFMNAMYGNEPACWSDTLTGIQRLRAITNYFTRMRFCTINGCLLFDYKGTIQAAPADHIPWYTVPNRKSIEPDIVFGHWAALEGKITVPHIHAIDTGCLWGGPLTALRLDDRQRFSVPGLSTTRSVS